MGTTEKYCLRFNDFSTSLTSTFRSLRHSDPDIDLDLFDATLACSDGVVKAHRLVLASCSPVFRTIFRQPHAARPHSVVYLKGMRAADLEAVLDFVYLGEVSLEQEELDSFMAVAEELKIKSLTKDGQQKERLERLDRPQTSGIKRTGLTISPAAIHPVKKAKKKNSLEIITVKPEISGGEDQSGPSGEVTGVDDFGEVEDYQDYDEMEVQEKMLEPGLENELGEEEETEFGPILRIAGTKRVMCLKCNKDFCDIYKARRHMKYVHPVEDMAVTCQICQAVLKNDCILKDHLRDIHKVFQREVFN